MKHIIILSLLISVSGLFSIYFLSINQEPQFLELEYVNSELIGTSVSTEGYIEKKTLHENGHMFLTVSKNNYKIDVPVFSNIMQDVDHRKFRKNSKIKVTGIVDEYRNNLQIIPRKHEDILLKD